MLSVNRDKICIEKEMLSVNRDKVCIEKEIQSVCTEIKSVKRKRCYLYTYLQCVFYLEYIVL